MAVALAAGIAGSAVTAAAQPQQPVTTPRTPHAPGSDHGGPGGPSLPGGDSRRSAGTAALRLSRTVGDAQDDGALDVWIDRAQRWFDPEREGFYPWVGSIMPSGWMAVGGGYRRTLARGIRADAMAGISLRNYKLLDATLSVPVTGDDTVAVDFHTRLMDAPRVNLHGVGNDSLVESRSRFDYEPRLLEARVRVRPQEGIEVGGSLGLLHIDTGPGAGDHPATDVFTPEEVPGLGDSASYRAVGLFAQVDRRDAPEFARRGGWYRADWAVFADGADRPYGHQRLDLDLRQFFPVFDERHAVLTRGVVSATNASGDDVVPHFMMPMLGDGENLRGFVNQRFVDRQRLLLQGEYRYRLNDRMHVAGFVDLGRVGQDFGDLSPGGFHTAGGAGIRVTTPDGLGIRVDLARSAERWSFIVSSVIF